MPFRSFFWFRETWRYLTLSPRSYLHQRAALRELDAHLLADLGLTRDQAHRGGSAPAVRTSGCIQVGIKKCSALRSKQTGV